MGLRVFVTRELFPFTAGGIGRVIANILMTTPQQERGAMAVLYVGDNVEHEAFALAHPDVRFLAWPHARDEAVDRQGLIYPPKAAYTHGMLHWESVHVLRGLLELERQQGPIEYVEFVDWGAQAFAATQEKLLGNALTKATLAVRLHTTDSLLADFEPRAPGVPGLNLYDLERKALADCDLVIGQVEQVAEAFREFYGFSHEAWDPRLRLHAPPVLLDTLRPAERTIAVDDTTPLLFTSKLQDIKRPDTFIRGCVQFLRARASYQGKVIFLAHSFDASYQDVITSLIPSDLRSRVVFARGVGGAAREQQIAGAVCVFPSPWESFCLAAYEASLSGAACILNARNPAFGPGSPWRDGENCGTFDGTAEDLARALLELFDGSRVGTVPVQVPADPRPWTELHHAAAWVPPTSPDGQLSVVVVNRDSGGRLLDTLDSILASNLSLARLVVIDDASVDPRDREVIGRLSSADARLVIHTLDARVGESAARNLGLSNIETPCVAFVRGGDTLMPGFLARAVGALAMQPHFDIIVGQVGITSDPMDVISGNTSVDAYRLFYGEARLAGVHENCLAPDTYVIRTATARRFAFDPVMPALEVWEMMVRACQAGTRFVVTSTVEVLSPHASPLTDQQIETARIAMRRRLQRKRARLGNVDVPAYFIVGQDSAAMVSLGEAGSSEIAYRLQELMDSESVRYTLALSALLHKHAPWSLRFGKWLVRRLEPVYRRLR